MWLYWPGPGQKGNLTNTLGGTCFFCCRSNRFRVVTTTVANVASAMAVIAATNSVGLQLAAALRFLLHTVPHGRHHHC